VQCVTGCLLQIRQCAGAHDAGSDSTDHTPAVNTVIGGRAGTKLLSHDSVKAVKVSAFDVCMCAHEKGVSGMLL
jgi:hypothetical protein